ncbi:heat shock factor protein-like [Argiope bruennichi]|uniref:Heat shock factor protein like n=1 Tax=Argiope bruennichi TaxID=94029 RepID=A0A8T0F7K9_ARGBR|nr:heat shock factor protein-like [Argiope bruennichi]KAF8786831.1 Heat shock factor protein like [Argiope bruennichi]
MRTIEYGTTTHVPAFLTKLWKLVTDVACDDLISWSLGGTSFIIYDEIRFSKELLPMYFKHNNMASFVRQLNMYGFRKLSCIDQGGMHCYKNEIEFYHQYFIKGQESLLELIKRKIPNSKSEEPKVKQEYIDELLSNLQTLKGKQDSAEQNMEILMRENKMLWRHVTALADRYTQQQTVIQQLLPFFMNIVRTRREMTLKRKPSLMIDEGETTHNKIARLSPQYFVHEDQDSNQGKPMSPGNVSNRGPVIHDVTEMENSKMYPATILCPSNSTTTKECEAIVDSPLSNSLESSEQTIDSQFTEAGSMETINILNQNFERRSRSNSYSPPMEMKHSPPSASASSMRRSSPPAMSSYASTSASSSSLSPTIIIDEATSDVPLPENIMRSPFAPKIEEVCSESGLYSMNSMMNDKVPPVINEETISILSESTSPLMNGSPSPLMNGSPSMNNGNKYIPSPSFASHLQNVKSDMPEINWMMNQPAPSYAPEQTIESWLGQFMKPDTATPSCSMSQPQGPPVGNVSFV